MAPWMSLSSEQEAGAVASWMSLQDAMIKGDPRATNLVQLVMRETGTAASDLDKALALQHFTGSALENAVKTFTLLKEREDGRQSVRRCTEGPAGNPLPVGTARAHPLRGGESFAETAVPQASVALCGPSDLVRGEEEEEQQPPQAAEPAGAEAGAPASAVATAKTLWMADQKALTTMKRLTRPLPDNAQEDVSDLLKGRRFSCGTERGKVWIAVESKCSTEDLADQLVNAYPDGFYFCWSAGEMAQGVLWRPNRDAQGKLPAEIKFSALAAPRQSKELMATVVKLFEEAVDANKVVVATMCLHGEPPRQEGTDEPVTTKEDVARVIRQYVRMNVFHFRCELEAIRERKIRHMKLSPQEEWLLAHESKVLPLRQAAMDYEMAKGFLTFLDDPDSKKPLEWPNDLENLEHLVARKFNAKRSRDKGKWEFDTMPLVDAVAQCLESHTFIFSGPAEMGKTPAAQSIAWTYAEVRGHGHYAQTSTVDSVRQLYVQGFFEPHLLVIVDDWRPGKASQDKRGDSADFLKALTDIANPGCIGARYSDVKWAPNMPRIVTSQIGMQEWVDSVDAVEDKEAVLKRTIWVEFERPVVPARLAKRHAKERQDDISERFYAIYNQRGYQAPRAGTLADHAAQPMWTAEP